MWFAYGFPIAWVLLLDSAVVSMGIGAHWESKKAIAVSAWLLTGNAVLVLIGFVPILAAWIRAILLAGEAVG